jgi:hypothetical protein
MRMSAFISDLIEQISRYRMLSKARECALSPSSQDNPRARLQYDIFIFRLIELPFI